MTDNPLKQYFRRPALYVKLPSQGLYYDKSVLNNTETGDLPVYPMTAIDEITARTPDALFNGTAVVEIVKSCIPNMLDPWKINSMDLDAILIAIKAASTGENFEIESVCPKCEESGKYNVNLTGLLLNLKSGNYDKEYNVGELYFKFRPFTFKEMTDISLFQFDVSTSTAYVESDSDEVRLQKNKTALEKITELTIKILTDAIDYIKTPVGIVKEKTFIKEFLLNCDKNTYNAVREQNASIREEGELKPLDVTCVNCQHPYQTKFTLNISDFFV